MPIGHIGPISPIRPINQQKRWLPKSDNHPKDSQKLYNKRNFKACEAWETAAYLGVCEDFEGERNAEITLLGDF